MLNLTDITVRLGGRTILDGATAKLPPRGDLSSQTLAAKRVPGLFAIGEAVDVTGWLGGYNFQWAWSSGWAAGEAV